MAGEGGKGQHKYNGDAWPNGELSIFLHVSSYFGSHQCRHARTPHLFQRAVRKDGSAAAPCCQYAVMCKSLGTFNSLKHS